MSSQTGNTPAVDKVPRICRLQWVTKKNVRYVDVCCFVTNNDSRYGAITPQEAQNATLDSSNAIVTAFHRVVVSFCVFFHRAYL